MSNAADNTPVLKAQNIGITFGGLKAVDSFSMEIGKSELVGLIGPNGAGKTTVFNLLTGVYQPTEGTFWLDGVQMNGKKTHHVVAAGIARTFQNIRLFKKMTVIENVKVAMNMHIDYSLMAAILRLPKYWKQEAELTKKANLRGSQALVNITVKNTGTLFLFIGKTTYYAEATVIEFDE